MSASGKAPNKIDEIRARLQAEADRAAAAERAAEAAPAASVAEGRKKRVNALVVMTLLTIILCAGGTTWMTFHRIRSVQSLSAQTRGSQREQRRGPGSAELRERFKKEWARYLEMQRAAPSPSPSPSPTP